MQTKKRSGGAKENAFAGDVGLSGRNGFNNDSCLRIGDHPFKQERICSSWGYLCNLQYHGLPAHLHGQGRISAKKERLR